MTFLRYFFYSCFTFSVCYVFVFVDSRKLHVLLISHFRYYSINNGFGDLLLKIANFVTDLARCFILLESIVVNSMYTRCHHQTN